MAWKVCETVTKKKKAKKDDFSITITVVGKAKDITRISFSDDILTQEEIKRTPDGIANKKLLIYENEESGDVGFCFVEEEPVNVQGITLLGKNHGLANITIPGVADLLNSFLAKEDKKVKIPLQKLSEEGRFLWVLSSNV